MFSGCNRKSSTSVNSELSTTEKDAFEKRAYDLRTDLLHQHTYDLANIPIADSLYHESERVHNDYGKMMALQVKYYVYVAYPDKSKELMKTIDEVIELSKKDEEFHAEYYDAVSVKVNYLIDKHKFMAAQYLAKEVMQRAVESNEEEGLYYANYIMGTVYQSRGNYSIAVPYLLKAEKYSHGDSARVSRVSMDISINYDEMKKYDLAWKYAWRSKQYAQTLVYRIWAEYTYLITLYDWGKEDAFLQAYDISMLKTTDVNGVVPAYKQKELRLRIAAANGNWDDAVKIADSIEFDQTRKTEIYNILLHKGDYKQAFEIKQELNAIEEKAQSEILMDDLSEMETRLGNSQLKLQSEELKLSRQHMLYVTIMVIIIAILATILTGIIHVYRRRVERQKQKIVEERELFYRNVTHQLRTPMTVVLGMVNQLKEHISPDDKVGMESVISAQRQSNNLLELIKKLIAASKEGELDEAFTSPHGDVNMAPTADYSPISGSPDVKHGAFLRDDANVPHILIAEDNDDVAFMLCNLLHENGYSAIRAVDGQQAWEMLQSDMPDLLITDIAMPRMDGLELMRNVRADDTTSHLPIIVVSARVEDHERLEGIRAGAEVYLAKPFINEELLLRVRKLLEQRELLMKRLTNSVESSEEVHSEIDDDEHAFIESVNDVIDANLKSGDISSSFIADKLGMSLSTLNRRIKNITSMSTSVYIRARRLLVAKSLLKTTTKPIAEVEYLCGFNTQGYFARMFKAETGMSPSEFRHQSMEK